MEDARKGEIVVRYIGEPIDKVENGTHTQDTIDYLMKIINNLYLDAEIKLEQHGSKS